MIPYLGLRLEELVSQIKQLLSPLHLTVHWFKMQLERFFIYVYRWEVTKSNFSPSLIAFCAISYGNVTHGNLMLLLALPHLPCGYTLPARSLLVKSSDKLPLMGTICCPSLIFLLTSTRSLVVTSQSSASERQHIFLEETFWQRGPEHPFHLWPVGI